MTMARMWIALAGLALAAGCSAASRPPAELDGLWSSGPAACAEGVGVRFLSDAIVAAYQDQRETLFARPRYAVLEDGQTFRVRIEYSMPSGRAYGRGVLVVERANDGGLAAQTHALMDTRTGAAHMRLQDDPAKALLALHPCGPQHGRRGGLRGLST